MLVYMGGVWSRNGPPKSPPLLLQGSSPHVRSQIPVFLDGIEVSQDHCCPAGFLSNPLQHSSDVLLHDTRGHVGTDNNRSKARAGEEWVVIKLLETAEYGFIRFQ